MADPAFDADGTLNDKAAELDTFLRRSALVGIGLTLVGGAGGYALGGPKHRIAGLLIGAIGVPFVLGMPAAVLLAPPKALTGG
jgi:hypothetical protein